MSRYYRAFDFAISSAGYNSYNELISLGPPAIFAPSMHDSLDDQEARAAYSEQQGASLVWTADRPVSIGSMIDAMMDKNLRSILSANARRIAKDNGASAAATAIAEQVR